MKVKERGPEWLRWWRRGSFQGDRRGLFDDEAYSYGSGGLKYMEEVIILYVFRPKLQV